MKATLADKGRMVVARFLDGKMLKGTIHDFTPNKTEFHLYEGGDERKHAVTVSAASLKALFFVKSFDGDAEHHRDDTFRGTGAQGGRKMRVRFVDGEELTGSTMGYNPQKQGFFLIPADPDDNNARVFVLNAAVAEVTWC
jgi:hypothetical protein